VFDRSFYGAAVEWMTAEAITSGTGAGLYSPDATVTRGELATFLFRMPQG
jgi:hypothetical protein